MVRFERRVNGGGDVFQEGFDSDLELWVAAFDEFVGAGPDGDVGNRAVHFHVLAGVGKKPATEGDTQGASIKDAILAC